MDMNAQIHDYYGIVESRPALDFVKKFIDAAPKNALAFYYAGDWPNGHKEYAPMYSTENVNKFSKYITRTMGHMYIKILDIIDRHGDASYYDFHAEILKPKGKPVGNDVELFKNLESQGLTELDHLGKYKRKFFRLTALGKLVLETAKKNQPAYRVLRHFMKIDENCDFYQKLVAVQLDPETADDTTPEAFTGMLEAILSGRSSLYEVGSYAYWCNKLVEALKKNDDFLELFNCPEVNAWLEANQTVSTVQRFNALFKKIVAKSQKEKKALGAV